MLTYLMDQRGGKTKFEFLYQAIKNDIQQKKLQPLEKLPSKRALAEHLGISVLTVENVYAQLVEEGYLFSRERSGFFVCDEESFLGPTEKERPRPLQVSAPDSTASEYRFPTLAKIMRQVISERGACLSEKVPHQGLWELRDAIANHLWHYRGMKTDPNRIVIGSGAEYLYVLLAQLFGEKKVFGIESPSYEKIKKVYSRLRVVFEELPMDETGIAGEALQQTRAEVLHVSPFHSFPTGISATPGKRREYLAWAKARGAILIEDDFDSEFSQSKKPLETIFSMDGGQRVIYLNTFSKSLAPSMRMGYMILPEPLWNFYEKKLGFYSCTVPAFDQYVLARFISEGHFERRLNRLRRNLRALP